MLIMGIDPGSMVTGYGLVTNEDNKLLRFVACGCVRTDSREIFHQRIKYIYDEVSRLIREYNPDQVALEDIFYSRNIKSAMQLGQARASAILAALNLDKEITIYSPREIKQALTGNGSAAKEQVQYMVLQILDIKKGNLSLDESDALAIAICHLNRRHSMISAY